MPDQLRERGDECAKDCVDLVGTPAFAESTSPLEGQLQLSGSWKAS